MNRPAVHYQCSHTAPESGSALAILTIFVGVMVVTIFALMSLGSQDAVLAIHDVRSSQALYVAEAGTQRARAWLEAQDEPPGWSSTFHPFGTGPDTLAQGLYCVAITPSAHNPGSTRKLYTVTSTATVGTHDRTLETELSTHSFAEYIYFTDGEHLPWSSRPIWFCSSDYIDGALHTNDQLHIFGDPTFGGEVTSAHGGPDDPDTTHVPAFLYYNGSYYNHLESAEPRNAPYDHPTFEAGYELGSNAIELPAVLDDYRHLARTGGITLYGDYEVVLGRAYGATTLHGYVSYRQIGHETWSDVPIESFNGILFIEGGAQVVGTLDGQLTVATADDMEIIGDVVYRGSDENGPLPDSDDVLGLVSETNIIVANTPANQEDCEIHAHMMALDTSFMVESYSWGSPRGVLTVHGGIVQKCRGPVGTGSLVGGQVIIRTGYAKDYHYDGRFKHMQPPGYYQTGEYSRLAWREIIDG